MVNTKEIRKLMIEFELSYADLGEQINKSPTTVRQKIYNVRPLSLNEAEVIQMALGIPDELFCFYFFSKQSRGATT